MIHYPLNTLKVSFTYTVGEIRELSQSFSLYWICLLFEVSYLISSSITLCIIPQKERGSLALKIDFAQKGEAYHTFPILINKDTDSSETQFSMNFLQSKCEIIQKSLYNLEVFNISTKIFLSIISAEISRCQRKCRQSNYHPMQSGRYLFTD